MKARYYILKLPASNPRWNLDVPSKINLNDYVAVWTDEIDFEDIIEKLEELFTDFNIFHPKNYGASSLSVGDVVLVKDKETRNITCYGCMGIGWKKVQVEEM